MELNNDKGVTTIVLEDDEVIVITTNRKDYVVVKSENGTLSVSSTREELD